MAAAKNCARGEAHYNNKLTADDCRLSLCKKSPYERSVFRPYLTGAHGRDNHQRALWCGYWETFKAANVGAGLEREGR